MADDHSRKGPQVLLHRLSEELGALAAGIETASRTERVPALRAEVARIGREAHALARALDRLADSPATRAPNEKPQQASTAAKPRATRKAAGVGVAVPTRPARPPRALVVDDNATQRDLVGRQLASQGIDELGVPGSTGLLASIQRFEPDVVVLDAQRPPSEGLEIVRIARAQRLRVGFIFYAAMAPDELRELARRAQADDWLVKTADATRLAAAVRALVARTVR